MLSLPSQLLLRNTAVFEQGKWALVNPTDAQIFSELSEYDITGLHQFHDIYQQASAISSKHIFDCAFSVDTPFDGAVIYLPKAKQHLEMLIANVQGLLKEGGQLLIVGENKAGIKSVAKLLEKVGDTPIKIDGAKHCGLVSVQKQHSLKASFDIKKYEVIRSYQVNDLTLQVCSLPGVFGHKQFDPGTQLLLQQFEKGSPRLLNTKGNVLDFACGTGIIGTYLAKANTKVKIVMSDVSALATYCAARTLELNEAQGQVIASDGMYDVPGTFDAIVSNPPFHTGIHTDYSITEKFILDAHKQTRPRGALYIVANRFLPYAELLESKYFKKNTVLDTNKFSIYEAFK